MAGPVLCTTCAQLPIKDRDAAMRFRRCPECKAEVGVTSYGARFRAPAAKRGQLLMRSVLLIAFGGAAAFSLLATFLWRPEPAPRVQPIVAVKPVPPVVFVQPIPLPEVEILPPDPIPQQPAPEPVPTLLLKIPEVALDDPAPHQIKGQKAAKGQRDLMGQIRRENAAKQDGFLLAHMDRRTELRGLPFIMGNDCQLGVDKGTALANSVREIRRELDRQNGPVRRGQLVGDNMAWRPLRIDHGSNLAALWQILAVADAGSREGLSSALSRSGDMRAGTLLAKSAIFDTSENVRKAAIASLKECDKDEYTDVLLQGMRYPLPSVAKNAADAVIALERKDLLPKLVDVLGEAGPSDPAAKQIDGKEVHVVREVVRINHHRNCLLCHAPVETGHPSEVVALMPTPGVPIPQSSQQYYGNNIRPDSLAVRADITYLRQDFSVLLPVDNAHPWPERQRFDFLVRTRIVEGNELAHLQKAIAERPRTYLSDQHKETVRALRELSGQDAVPTEAAWRRVLGLNRAED